ncbi:MAG: ATP-binding cassette domain-containing protein [Flavobacteriales bacterium]|nr:ATP-binding cassette domain-containing protein [Flavobacteriales bacterium]
MILLKCHKQLSFAEGSFQLDVDLCVQPNEILAIRGRSGAGKTTLLRILSGLDRVKGSQVRFHDQVWQDDAAFIKPGKRGIGFLMQQTVVFDHMTVKENVAFGTQGMRDDQLVNLLLETCELSGLSHLHPTRLSGGQRRRIALARTLALRPRLLLLDEPFSGMDAQTISGLKQLIRDRQREDGFSAIMVSHQQSDYASLASRELVMSQGKLSAGNMDLSVVEGVISHVTRTNGQLVAEISTAIGLMKVPLPPEISAMQVGNTVRMMWIDGMLKIDPWNP